MRAVFANLGACLSLLVLAGCVEAVTSTTGPASDFIVVSDFAVAEGVVHLDPSFGFSLYRGAPGVPEQRRALSIGRAVGFLVSDAITERLRGIGYDTASTTDPSPVPDKRALIVTGRFRAIDEGSRRRVGSENSAVIAEVQVKAQVPGRGVETVQSFTVDSRTAPRVAATRRETGVDADATRVGAEIARVVAEIARRNNWLPARR